jgi:hypothetical protein
MEFHRIARFGRRGQLTMLDLALAPLAAVVLAVLASALLHSATANLLTAVNQQPTALSCNFALDSIYSTYYVHTSYALSQIALSNPAQYALAESNKQQSLSANCSGSCSSTYSYSQNYLYNSSSLYSDFIGYFSGFSLSDFGVLTGQEAATLNALGIRVFLNSIPAGVTGTEECSLKVYNPANPSSPYTIYGVMK